MDYTNYFVLGNSLVDAYTTAFDTIENAGEHLIDSLNQFIADGWLDITKVCV